MLLWNMSTYVLTILQEKQRKIFHPFMTSTIPHFQVPIRMNATMTLLPGKFCNNGMKRKNGQTKCFCIMHKCVPSTTPHIPTCLLWT